MLLSPLPPPSCSLLPHSHSPLLSSLQRGIYDRFGEAGLKGGAGGGGSPGDFTDPFDIFATFFNGAGGGMGGMGGRQVRGPTHAPT